MIVGLCRFSYLSRYGGAWKKVPLRTTKARQILFDKDRLESRFELFESYTLPGIRNQTDDEFRFVILISSDIPKHYHDRLMDITNDDPKIKVRAFPPRRTGPLINEMFSEEFGDADRRISFRLDDDDGLSVNFIKRLRKASRARGARNPFFVSFSKGILVHHEGRKAVWASECSFPFLSMGLALVTSREEDRCVYDFNHRDCFRHFDTVVLSGRPGFVRCIHDSNDSEGKPLGTKSYSRTGLADVARRFEKEFPYLTAGS